MRFVLLGRSAAFLVSVFAVATCATAFAGDSERFQYEVTWRLIRAGTVVIDASAAEGRIKLDSAGLVSALFRIDDTYTVRYDPGHCATGSLLDSQEGKRHRETRITFDRGQNKATYVLRDVKTNTIARSDTIDIPNCVHDVLGAIIQLRAAHLEPGHYATYPISDGRRAAQVKVDAQDREDVTTPSGTVHAIRYEAGLFNGVVYPRSGRVQIWLTDDARRLPVQIVLRMGFPIGTVTLQLAKEEHP